MPVLFPFNEYFWFYALFTVAVLALVLLDLGVFHKKAHEVGIKESLVWCTVWIGLALVFNVVLYQYSLWRFSFDPRLNAIAGFDPQAAAWQVALEYLTGFVIEKSLAVDNIFVFVLIFSALSIPQKYQHRILCAGIIGALVFRVIFIAAGSVLMSYHLVVQFFGLLLVLTGLKILLSPRKPISLDKSPLIRWVQKVLPFSTQIEGQKFIVRRDGKWLATPLFLALVVIELCDVVFALDSVPAIYAITKEPLIVFTSNIFAILGLRAMYFLLADAMHRFQYLKYGLGVILCFVGLKMLWLNEAFDGKFPITWSLGIIAAILFVSVIGSLISPIAKVERSAEVLR